jgi:hypothetical protein
MIFYILKLMTHIGLLDGNLKKKVKKNTYYGKNKILTINYNFLNKLLEFYA